MLDHAAPVGSLLLAMYGDREMAATFSLESTIATWLRAEAALATAQAAVGDVDGHAAAAIASACRLDRVDIDAVLAASRDIGYPILALVRQIAAQLPDGPNGRMHFGATTQDIMDTGLALQLGQATSLLSARLVALGDALATLVTAHADTVLAGRTHGQQAVPTTFGAKLGVFLDQVATRLGEARTVGELVAVLSLHGGAGTSAALGPHAGEVRAAMAAELGLAVPAAPWHVNRDRVVAFGRLCGDIAVPVIRLAREIVDLSRSEIAEVREPRMRHSGASSTMPQKINPVLSEAAIGLGVSAEALLPALVRAAEAGHERASGEWQVEWHVVPQLAVLTCSAVSVITRAVDGLQVFPEVMCANLAVDHGLLMAEAYMMVLADKLGRERAHDLVYDATAQARQTSRSLADVLSDLGLPIEQAVIEPAAYLGDAPGTARLSVARWTRTREAGS